MNLGFTTTNFQRVSAIEIPDIFYNRYKTNNDLIDQMFGNGIIPGATYTITATPGSGKSTFLLQVCELLAKNGLKVGYITGEESIHQVAFNCKRLNVEDVNVANITDVDEISKVVSELNILVIDSFQAITSKEDMTSRKREEYIVNNLINQAQEHNCCIFFVMHITKAGHLKGGTVVPHSVDGNIKIEKVDEDPSMRSLVFEKHRFGPTGEYPLRMTDTGFVFQEVFDDEGFKVTKPNKPISKQEEIAKKIKELIYNSGDGVNSDDIDAICDAPKHVIYGAIRDLTNKNIIRKYGRGDSAVFRKYEG